MRNMITSMKGKEWKHLKCGVMKEYRKYHRWKKCPLIGANEKQKLWKCNERLLVWQTIYWKRHPCQADVMCMIGGGLREAGLRCACDQIRIISTMDSLNCKVFIRAAASQSKDLPSPWKII